MLPNYLDRKMEGDFFEETLRDERLAKIESSIQSGWTLISLDALIATIHTGWYVGSTQEFET